MEIESALVRLCEPVLSEAGYELVRVEVVGVAGRRTARFFIDTLGGVTLEDCTAVSRMIDPVISRNRIFDGPYVLEISSPGLERPLVKLSDYQRFSDAGPQKVHRPDTRDETRERDYRDREW